MLIRLFLCVAALGGFLYAYMAQQNAITELRLEIPQVTAALKVVEQENTQLQFRVDQFENPAHLMELARQPEFAHLKHPRADEVITLSP